VLNKVEFKGNEYKNLFSDTIYSACIHLMIYAILINSVIIPLCSPINIWYIGYNISYLYIILSCSLLGEWKKNLCDEKNWS